MPAQRYTKDSLLEVRSVTNTAANPTWPEEISIAGAQAPASVVDNSTTMWVYRKIGSDAVKGPMSWGDLQEYVEQGLFDADELEIKQPDTVSDFLPFNTVRAGNGKRIVKAPAPVPVGGGATPPPLPVEPPVVPKSAVVDEEDFWAPQAAPSAQAAPGAARGPPNRALWNETSQPMMPPQNPPVKRPGDVKPKQQAPKNAGPAALRTEEFAQPPPKAAAPSTTQKASPSASAWQKPPAKVANAEAGKSPSKKAPPAKDTSSTKSPTACVPPAPIEASLPPVEAFTVAETPSPIAPPTYTAPPQPKSAQQQQQPPLPKSKGGKTAQDKGPRTGPDATLPGSAQVENFMNIMQDQKAHPTPKVAPPPKPEKPSAWGKKPAAASAPSRSLEEIMREEAIAKREEDLVKQAIAASVLDEKATQAQMSQAERARGKANNGKKDPAPEASQEVWQKPVQDDFPSLGSALAQHTSTAPQAAKQSKKQQQKKPAEPTPTPAPQQQSGGGGKKGGRKGQNVTVALTNFKLAPKGETAP